MTLLFAIVFFTRVLTPGELGEYFYFESLLGMASIFVAFGISGATEKYVSEGKDINTWYSTGLVILLFASVFGALVFTGIAHFFEQILESSLLPLFALALVSKQQVTFFRHMFRGEFRASFDGVLDLIRVVTFITIGILALKAGLGSLGLIIAAILGRVLVLPVALSKLEMSFVSPSIDNAAKILNFSKYYFITIVGSKVFHFADVVLIGILLTKVEVGMYEIAWRLILAGILLNGVVAGTAFSYISHSNKGGSFKDVTDNLHLSMRYILIIPFGVLGGAFTIGPDLLTVFFTTEYVVEEYLLGMLAIGFVFQAFYFLFSRSLVAINRPRQAFIATSFTTGMNVVLNIILIQKYGMIGAALATTLSFGFAAVVFFILIRRHISVRFPKRKFIAQLMAAAIMVVVLTITGIYLSPLSALETIFIFLTGGGIYLGVLTLYPPTRKDLLALGGLEGYLKSS